MPFSRLTIIVGNFGFFLASTSSIILGRPLVAITDVIPAEWNVLSIICVLGSPIDCAATVPAASPGTTLKLLFFSFAMISLHLNELFLCRVYAVTAVYRLDERTARILYTEIIIDIEVLHGIHKPPLEVT